MTRLTRGIVIEGWASPNEEGKMTYRVAEVRNSTEPKLGDSIIPEHFQYWIDKGFDVIIRDEKT